jgi:hypothetical protein
VPYTLEVGLMGEAKIAERLLGRVPGLTTHTQRVEAGSHLAWGGFLCSYGHLIAGRTGFGLAFAVWITWSYLTELVGDGHLKRILRRTETKDEAIDFAWDLFTRFLGPILVWWVVR